MEKNCKVRYINESIDFNSSQKRKFELKGDNLGKAQPVVVVVVVLAVVEAVVAFLVVVAKK